MVIWLIILGVLILLIINFQWVELILSCLMAGSFWYFEKKWNNNKLVILMRERLREYEKSRKDNYQEKKQKWQQTQSLFKRYKQRQLRLFLKGKLTEPTHKKLSFSSQEQKSLKDWLKPLLNSQQVLIGYGWEFQTNNQIYEADLILIHIITNLRVVILFSQSHESTQFFLQQNYGVISLSKQQITEKMASEITELFTQFINS